MSDRNDVEIERREADNRWHLDKRVPITLIFAILLQTVVFAYGYGQLAERVETNSKRINEVSDLSPRLVRLETLMEGVHSTLKDIRDDIRDRKNDRK